MKSPCMVKFLAVALFLCAGTLSATAFSKSGGGKNTTAAQKTEGPQADQGAEIYDFGYERELGYSLKGTLFDLMTPKSTTEFDRITNKQTRERKFAEYYSPEAERKRLKDALSTLLHTWKIEDIKKKFISSETKFSTTNIYYSRFPMQNINGHFFKVKTSNGEVGLVPNCWLCYYEGYFGVPAEGDYRFVGSASTVMLVGVDALDKKGIKPVLYAFIPEQGYGTVIKGRCPDDWEPGTSDGEVNGSDLYKGTWLHLRPGERYPIKIALGYCREYDDAHPQKNSSSYAYLGVQRIDHERRHLDDDKNFPLFTLEKLKTYQKVPGRPLLGKGPYNTSCVFAPPEE